MLRFDRLPLLCFLCVPALAGCMAAPARDDASVTATRATTDGRLKGQILLPRELSAPPEGVLHLQLVPRFNPAPMALSSARIEFATPPPWAFALPFERARVGDPTLYRVDVALFDQDGHLRFVSDGEHPVNLDVEAEPTRIVLIPLDSTDPSVSELVCDGATVTLQLSGPDLVLSIDALPRRLRRAHSAVGQRYVGPDAELWLQADQARLQLGERSLSCAAAAPGAR